MSNVALRETMKVARLNDKICMAVRVYFWGVLIEYVASYGVLVEAGCITRKMATILQAPPRKGGPRRMMDENGYRFTRRKMATKAVPDQVKIERSIEDPEDALALPGMRDLFPDGLRLPGDEPEAEPKPDLCTFEQRDRVVGRFRRRVRWETAAKLIFVDWARVRIDRLRQHDGAA